MHIPLSDEDLKHTLVHAESAFAALRGARLFVTGGTGFFGKWLLETFRYANRELSLGASMTVLSRNPGKFVGDMRHLANDNSIEYHSGDVTSFQFPTGAFTHIIHAATETNADLSNPTALALFDASVDGTRRVLEFARSSGARRLLFTSSGAVYGPQPAEITHVPEDCRLAPVTSDFSTAYGHGKRAAEFLCTAYSQSYGIESVFARCFAFVGPHLPLNSGFAIGNFIRDALAGGPVSVGGDGAPYRSYLYAADLAAWLWALLVRGASCRAYNVGSDQSLTIAELARKVACCLAPNATVKVAETVKPGQPARRYVPSIARARDELGLEVWVPLDDAIRRSGEWHRLNVAP